MAGGLLPRTFRCKMLELLQTRELHSGRERGMTARYEGTEYKDVLQNDAYR